jgi:cell division protein FtsW
LFPKIDKALAAAVFFLVIFGVVTMSSVSVYESYKLMTKINGTDFCAPESGVNCNSFYLNKHILHALLSFAICAVGFIFPTAFFRQISLPLFIASFGLLFVVFSKNFGSDWGTAQSWINVPFLPSIQPSEIMKLAIIFYLALWLEKKESAVQSFEHGFLPFVILLILAIFPLALQPDFGSILVIGAIAVSMFFVAGGNFWQIFGGGILASFVAWPVILSHEYILKRFLSFLNPDAAELGAGFQIKQSLIAVGSGGFWGVGVGNSQQRFGWLPEVQSDTVFAAMAEELGFFRIILILGIFAFISWRGFLVAQKTENRFDKILAAGITAWLAFQTLINIAVTLALFPLTGITLPFISAGGSSLLALMFAAGILLRISATDGSGGNLSRRHFRRRF